MVPNGWSLKLISDTAKVITGNTPSTKDSSYYNGDIPFVSPADLGANKLISSANKTLTKKGFDKSRAVRKGSTLFTCIGSTIGKLGQANCELATNQQINAVIPYSSFDDDFIYYQLEMRAKFISKLAGTQAVPIINKTTFESQNLLVPDSLPEQRKIAKILSTWDKAIATTEQLIATSQQQKKALMQQLLTGKKRLLNPETGKVFEGDWEEVKLGDVLTKISNGLTYDSKATQGLPVSRIETISTGKVNHAKVGYAPNDEKTIKFKLQFGDILYSHINSLEHIGRVAYFLDDKDLYHGMNLLLLRASKDADSKFIYFMLSSSLGKEFARSHAKSAVNQASISTTDLKGFKAKLPGLGEQQKIASVLTAADKEIELLEAKLTRLKEEKKALMQQLLTGKRRVKVDTTETA